VSISHPSRWPTALQQEIGEGFELAEHRFEAHTTPGGVAQRYLYCRFRRSGEWTSQRMRFASGAWKREPPPSGVEWNARWNNEVIYVPLHHAAQIDVSPSSINLKKTKTVSVSILSSGDFNAPKSVDRRSLTFGPEGDEESLLSCETRKLRDVNGDGFKDLVCKFSVVDAGFGCGYTHAILRGSTLAGTVFEASQPVLITPCK
jgi:hypothetical protein